MSTRFRSSSLALATALALAGCDLPVDIPVKPTGAQVVLVNAGNRPAAPKQGGPRTDVSDAVRNTAAEFTDTPGRLLLAVYMIGSDLEDDVNPKNDQPDEADNKDLSREGNATKDLLEIVKAYQGLSEAEKANVDVLVAFGGARQTGWKGMKIMTLKGLLEDAEDGYFGNATAETYLADQAGVNMGSGEAFQTFLQRVEAQRAGSSKVFLDVWNHGGSYAGIGPDTNTDGRLSTSAIRAALQATNFKADLIGFDACLMASAEVISAVSGHFGAMVASEETEPGHGWDYSLWLVAAAKRPEAGASEIGRMVVDSFLDSPAHAETSGRTLSVINLTKADALLGAMDRFAGAYRGTLDAHYQDLLSAAGSGPKYGTEGKAGDEFALDLFTFADAVKRRAPLGTEADDVMKAVKDCVVYSREDGTRTGSHGISVFSLANLQSFQNEFYGRGNASSPTWFGLVEAFMARGANDSQPPVVEQATEEVLQAGAAPKGNRATLKDDTGIEDAYAVMGVRRGEGLAMLALTPADDTEVFVPEWDGRALHLNGQPVSTTLEEELEDGFTLHSADVSWNDEDAVMFLVLDANRQVVNSWVVPYEEKANGDTVLSREQFELLAGDVLTLYTPVLEKGEIAYEESAPLTLGATPDFAWKRVDGQAARFAVAVDLKGHAAAGTAIAVP